uniref:DDHD domain-containing protein n=1 Tax=Ciona savignyi TaxID=51511 RepID=H2YTI5_CIOSA
YQAVTAHWFYCKVLSDTNQQWCPFSYVDSQSLENAARELANGQGCDVVRTDGGRYDVSFTTRERTSVYWDEPAAMVRRCTWFNKSDAESRFTPYEESLAESLEREYHEIVSKGMWHKQIDLGKGEMIVVHNPQLIVHFQPIVQAEPDFGAVREAQMRSKVVKRGIAATDFVKIIPENECGTPDHVVFLCHGIGPVCDLRSRSVVECVDDFRAIHLSLLRSHFKNGLESNKAHRIEFLPIHWHRALHGDATGVDRNIRRLTLPSISRLRHFTNETLLDILFYSSPVYCQTIAETIGNEINSLHKLFMSRNPNFKGSVSLSGHSLGSLILFDLLCHQNSPSAATPAPSQSFPQTHSGTSQTSEHSETLNPPMDTPQQLSSSNSFDTGTGQPAVRYPQLDFQPHALFAMGSPIGMFLTVRGISELGEDFALPTCPGFINIFHPFDPVAYRVEPLINPDFNLKPILVPHYKGRKRLHLELRDSLGRMGQGLKDGIMKSVRLAIGSMQKFAESHWQKGQENLNEEVKQLIKEQEKPDEDSASVTSDVVDLDVGLGRLNGGKRIDFVLQERPLESFNDYLFAFQSHLCYWNNEDTVLLMMREIYDSMGVKSDSQL